MQYHQLIQRPYLIPIASAYSVPNQKAKSAVYISYTPPLDDSESGMVLVKIDSRPPFIIITS